MARQNENVLRLVVKDEIVKTRVVVAGEIFQNKE